MATRSLTCYESSFLLVDSGPVVGHISVPGRIDGTVLDRAWRLLNRDYPLLRYHIHASDGTYTVALTDDITEVITGPPAEDSFVLALNDSRVHRDEASRLRLFQSDDAAAVSLAVSHALADARLVETLVARLLRYYKALLGGDVPSPSARSAFDVPLDERLLGRYAPLHRYDPLGAGQPAVLPAPSRGLTAGFGAANLTLTPAATAEVVAAARSQGCTVTDLVCAALACALRDQFPVDGPVPITVGVAVDLRRRLTPPVSADEQICCVGLTLVGAHITAEHEPPDLVRLFSAGLRTAVERAEPQRAVVAESLGRGAGTPGAPFTCALSNLGVVESPRLRFAATVPGPVPGLFMATSGGRLNLDLVYDRAHLGADQVEDVLSKVGAGLVRPREGAAVRAGRRSGRRGG